MEFSESKVPVPPHCKQEPQQTGLALKASAQKENPTETWYIDLVASGHFCPYLELLEEFKPSKTSITITNNSTVPILGQGNIQVTLTSSTGKPPSLAYCQVLI
ncbi:hypothetical protein H4R33_006785 [Dimargaris cristalligena]|nr:hypothetical protein H4R33_006785 [Dimargaris cristalligena]